MKYAIVTRNDSQSLDITKQIKNDFKIVYDEDDPDFIISLGGDGTFLAAVRKYIDRLDKVIFIGVNTGHLGFYTDWMVEDLKGLEEKMLNGDFIKDKNRLLEFSINGKIDYALNELTVIKANSVQVVDVYIDDKLFETFRGTGLCVSTTNGSTAYNKSLGGPVVDPMIEAFILTEIASINSNAYRSLGSPIILSKHYQLKLKFHDSVISYDQVSYLKEGNCEINCWLSNRCVYFAKKGGVSYFDRVKKSFL